MIQNLLSFMIFIQSVFAGCPIPYPKREFLSDEDQDDKSETNKRPTNNVREITTTVNLRID